MYYMNKKKMFGCKLVNNLGQITKNHYKSITIDEGV